jgi:hypothetical protein
MDTQTILILLSAGSVVQLGLILRLFWLRGEDKALGALKPPVAGPVIGTPIPLAPVATPPASRFVVCATCGHTVARWAPTAKGPVCANCQPL